MFVSRSKILKASLTVCFCVFAVFAAACSNSRTDANGNNANSSNQTAPAANENLVKDEPDELGTIVRLPETPEDATWREENTADPKGKKITAVLKFSPEATARIISSAEKIKPAAEDEIGSESWFPEELTAQSQLSGNESIKTVAYAANDFFNPPYTNGKLSRIRETNYFVLELTTY